MKENIHKIYQKQIDELVSFLTLKGVKFALLGDPTGESVIESDLDLCVENVAEFDIAIKSFCNSSDRSLLTKRSHSTGIRYDFSFRNGNDLFVFHGPDLLIFPTWHIKGDIGLSYREVIKNRIKCVGGCYKPSPVDAFVFYLVKRIDKQEIGEKQATYLSHLWSQDPAGIANKLKSLLTDETISLVSSAASTGCWDSVKAKLPIIFAELASTKRVSIPRLIWILKRIILRFSKPTGLFIVFLGPDGSGKSSVIRGIFSSLMPPFTNASYTHLRPRVCLKKGNGTIVTNPHNEPSRSLIGSTAKLVYFLFDYWIGYLFKIKPLLIKSSLVVFDRYYYDLLIDPKRYRHGRIMWIALLISKIIPRPDIIFLLDAPPEVLQSRKQEVPFEETARQRDAYLQFIQGRTNGIVIDASQPLPEVVQATRTAILSFLKTRMEKRSKIKGIS